MRRALVPRTSSFAIVPLIALSLACRANGAAKSPTRQSAPRAIVAAGPAKPRVPLAGSSDCESLSAFATSPRLRVAANMMHTCAWDEAGKIWCWGDNAAGELGDGTREQRLRPVRAVQDVQALQVEIGNRAEGGFSCALAFDHTVRCWGVNTAGQLGDGTTVSRNEPAPVAGLSNVVEIAVGVYHACARLTSGSVRCWGEGQSCDLGDGQSLSRTIPVEVPGTEGAVQLALGISFSCARMQDGSVLCWGGNAHGEAGNGSTIAVLRATTVDGLHDVVAIAASGFNPCAQVRDGRIYCWGGNKYGALGIGSRADAVTTPVEVHDVPCGARLMSGAKCALREDGHAYCWGVQNGDGTMLTHEMGAALVPIEHVVAVFGYRTLFALTDDETLWGWGYNERGQLGDGSRIDRWSPVAVAIPQ